jgi:hypothetical protein
LNLCKLSIGRLEDVFPAESRSGGNPSGFTGVLGGMLKVEELTRRVLRNFTHKKYALLMVPPLVNSVSSTALLSTLCGRTRGFVPLGYPRFTVSET